MKQHRTEFISIYKLQQSNLTKVVFIVLHKNNLIETTVETAGFENTYVRQ